MKKTNICAAVVCDIGRVRGNNEDNFYFNGSFLPRERMDGGAFIEQSFNDGLQIYAVFDGMGGQSAGEEASSEAAALLCERAMSFRPAFIKEDIDAFTACANERILSKNKNMGCTMALIAFIGRSAFTAHLGDSRVYLLRGGRIYQLTRDHTEARRLCDIGAIKEEDMKTHPMRNALTRFLGMDAEGMRICPQYSDSIAIQKQDRVLICSDGLTDMVSDAEILASLRFSPRDACLALKDAALAAGGRDNITIIAAEAQPKWTLF